MTPTQAAAVERRIQALIEARNAEHDWPWHDQECRAQALRELGLTEEKEDIR